MKKLSHNKLLIAFVFIFFLTISIVDLYANEWKEFHSLVGRCKILFPSLPQHIEHTIPIENSDKNLQYDVYISSQNENAIYFMVIAQYPMFIEDNMKQDSLEGFLNGILSHQKNNELLSADLNEFQGHTALDFLIKSDTRYFQGKVIVLENKLYLIAMEHNDNDSYEVAFNKYIESFSLIN